MSKFEFIFQLIKYHMDFQAFPDDMVNYLFGSFLTSKTRADICSVNTWFEKTMIRISKELSPTPDLYHWNQLHRLPKKRCKEISLRDYHLIARLKQINRLDFSEVCKIFDLDVLMLFLENCGEIEETGRSLAIIAKTGNVNIFELLIRCFYWTKEQLEDAIEAASRIGNVEIVKSVINRNEKLRRNINPESGVIAASKHGHIEVIKYLETIFVDWSACIWGAAKGGQLSVIDFACTRHEFNLDDLDDLDEGLYWACRCNHPAAVRKLVELGAAFCENCGQTADDHQ